MNATTRKSRRPDFDCLEHRTLLSADPSRLLLGLEPGVAQSWSYQTVLRAIQGRVLSQFGDGSQVIELAGGRSIPWVVGRLERLSGVAYVEVDRPVETEAIVPDDTQFGSLWGLSSGNDVDIDAPEAWSTTRGDRNVIVAVVDSGVDVTHPDLAAQIWTNSREIPGNGRDDDRNGYVDDIQGWNFLNGNHDLSDGTGHGTHVAGTIAAVMNNGLGVVGVAPGIRLMPLKFIGRSEGAISDAVAAIHYAVDQGADVINASWGGSTGSSALNAAIQYANSHQVVFVTAAGNNRSNNDASPNYPANYRQPNLLAVAAVGTDGRLASFSNYGARTVDVAAPGVSILSTAPEGGYQRLSGTSMATAHVSGIAALVRSASPKMSAASIANQIRDTVKQLPALSGKLIAAGIASAAGAVSGLVKPQSLPPSDSLIAVPADYDGDGRTDAAVYSTLTGSWAISTGATGPVRLLAWGAPGDVPVPADYDGDGRTDLAVYRPFDGTWYVQPSSGKPLPNITWGTAWGGAGDIPMPGDYDGDGRMDLAIYRPSTSRWFIRPTSGTPMPSQGLGVPGDIAFPADYDGDGRTDLAVYRPSTSQWSVRTVSGTILLSNIAFGTPGDIPVPADFDGDGRTDLGVYRPSTAGWFARTLSGTPIWYQEPWGGSGDVPIPADFSGSGGALIAVHRPSTNQWFVRYS